MEIVKRVNGHVIKILSRNEINEELKSKGEWTIEYYVPGRKFYPYFITIDRQRYRFELLDKLEKVCKKYKPADLKGMERNEINKLIYDLEDIL